VATKIKPFKLPKTLAECADLLYRTREDRLAMKKLLAHLEGREKKLRDHLIDKLPKGKSTGVAGRLARASIYTEPTPTVEDWDALWRHVKKTGHFDLLQKRISKEAVEARWGANKTVPGVGRFNVVRVSLEKVKR
jgi:hypothetical protein